MANFEAIREEHQFDHIISAAVHFQPINPTIQPIPQIIMQTN